jgi:hypothetical protein
MPSCATRSGSVQSSAPACATGIIEANDGTRSLPNRPDVPNLPIVELYSMRTGVTLSLRRLW